MRMHVVEVMRRRWVEKLKSCWVMADDFVEDDDNIEQVVMNVGNLAFLANYVLVDCRLQCDGSQLQS